MLQRFRIFISSPSDVFAERERVERVIVRLNGEFGGDLLEAIRWERSYYTAAKTFQDQIPLPSQTDLVLCILWKRLGFELPADYRRPDGTTPTGTEWEFEDAMQAARARGTPDVLVYRKAAPVLLDAEQVELERAQFEALKTFWSRWFRSETGQFTAAYQSFETADHLEAQVEDHIRQWLARHKVGAPGVTWSIDVQGSPFRGLQPFDAGHAAVFFGRRRAVEHARERLVDAAGRGTPFLLVLGASGSGKSSLVRAGLVPRLTQPGAAAGVDAWRICVMRPGEGDTPLHALARALYAPGALPELAGGDCPAPPDFAGLLAAAPDAAARAVRLALARAFAGVAEREGFGRPVEARLLLAVDQFEEGLTPDGAAAFAVALASLAGAGCWVVATLRSDLYGLFQRVPALVALRDGGAQIDVHPPGPADLPEIVAGSAAAAGLRYGTRPDGTGLDEELVAAAAAPGALPLLQLALDALFEARDPATGTLTCAAYDAMGGLPGVVERRAEAALAGLDAAAQAALPRVLPALVDVTDEGQVISRPAPLSRIAPAPDAARLVQAFVDARLLVADTRGDEPGVRVAHESLLSGWPRACTLLAADREVLRVRARVEAACRRWLAEGRHPDFLLAPGRPLAEAADLAGHHGDNLDGDGRAFVEASQAAESARRSEAQAQAERELRLGAAAAQARADAATALVRRTRAAAAVVGALLVVAAGAAVVANRARQEAQRQTAQAERNFNAALTGGAGLVDAVNAHLRDGGMTREVAVALLGQAQGSLGGLAEAGAASPALADTQARLLSSFSTVQVALCDGRGAVARAAEAVAIAEATVRDAPSDTARQTLARALAAQGAAGSADLDFKAALAAYRRAEALQAALPGAEAQEDLQTTRAGISDALLATDDPAGAATVQRAILAFHEARAAERPDDPQRQGNLANSVLRLGNLELARKSYDAATAAYARHAGIVRALQARQPSSVEWQRALAINEVQSARILAKQGDTAGAVERYRRGAADVGRVAAADAGNSSWQRSVIWAQINLSATLIAGGAATEALQVLEPALKAAAALSGPGVTAGGCLRDVALVHDMASNELFVLDRKADAAAAAAVGLDAYQRYAAAAPGDAEREWEVVGRHHRLATFLGPAGRPAEAAAQLRAGLALAAHLPDGGSADRLDELSAMRLELGNALAEAGDRPAALAAFAALPPAAAGDDGRGAHEQAMGQYRIGKLLLESDSAAAGAALASALDGVRAALAAQPGNARWRSDLVSVAQQRAGWLLFHGDKPVAIALYLEALDVAGAVLAEKPADAVMRHQHAGALLMASMGYRVSGQADEAADYYRRYKEELGALASPR